MATPLQQRLAFSVATTALTASPSESDRFSFHTRYVALDLKDSEGRPLISAPSAELKRRLGQKKVKTRKFGVAAEGEGEAANLTGPGSTPTLYGDSDIGVVFLERTRIRPAGFSLGEHLMALSLAPGEEVTIEQKTYSERQTTFEDVTDQEDTKETEYSSTLSTEMSNALQRATNGTRSDQSNVGGSIGGTIYGVSLSVSGGTSTTLSASDTDSRNDTAKHVKTASDKIASKYRAQHKISLKISETTRFESAQKRVLKNPNPYTPIDLMYFKVLQKLHLSHERFGVRYCWAPFVKDPGAVVDGSFSRQRQIFQQQIPAPPVPPPPPQPAPPGNRPIVSVALGLTELKKWGIWGDMRFDYEFDIAPPADYEWDGDVDAISRSLMFVKGGWGARGLPNVQLLAAAANGSHGVKVVVHAGVDWGGAGASLRINLSANFRPLPLAPDATYVVKLEKWAQDKAAWQKANDEQNAEWQAKIEAAMEEWAKTFWKKFDPVSAAMQLLVSLLPSNSHDQGNEVELWNMLFDFDGSQIMLYPSWWSDRPSRDPASGPCAFQNASWARIFLPIRGGFEARALRWLLTQQTAPGPAGSPVEARIRTLVDEIVKFRMANFGGPEEITVTPPVGTSPCPTISNPYICLGYWEDVLPTDGTHLEILQAITSAQDDLSQGRLDRQALEQTANTESLTKDAAVKDAIAKSNPTPTTVVVNLPDPNRTSGG